MKVLAFAACEQIVHRSDGSLDVLGFGLGGIEISAASGGVKQTQSLQFVAVVDFTPPECGEHAVDILLAGPDGDACGKVLFQVQVERGSTRLTLAQELTATFDQTGDHALVLLVDRTERQRWPWIVRVGGPTPIP